MKLTKLLLPLLLSGMVLCSCGETGPQGERGPQGNQGEQGNQGDTGADGKSAYELYCDEHPEYQGTLQEWLDEFFSKDDTDYSHYDDFLFTETTYGGVVGYSANYIGNKKDIIFPNTFKNKPVLLATIQDSVFSAKPSSGDEIPALENIYFPSNVKVVSISETIIDQYDLSNVKTHFVGNLDRFDVPYYPYGVYFEGTTHESYWSTNLRKFFPFSNVYLKNGDSYQLDIDGDEQISKFKQNVYNVEGGIKDQISEFTKGMTTFTKFGDFELAFPEKFTFKFDDYDITLPLSFSLEESLDKYPGVTFDKNLIKGDSSKYKTVSGYHISASIDFGIAETLFDEFEFDLYGSVTKIKMNDSTNLDVDVDINQSLASTVDLLEGENTISLYNGDDLVTNSAPLTISDEIRCNEITINEAKKLVSQVNKTYYIRVDLNNLEILLAPNEETSLVKNEVRNAFNEENGFLGSRVIVLESKEIILPKSKKVSVNGRDYNVDLSYHFANNDASFTNIDSGHPTVSFVESLDTDNDSVISRGFSINYSVADGLFTGVLQCYVTIIRPIKELKLSLTNGTTFIRPLFFDVSEVANNKAVWRLNELVIQDTTSFFVGAGSLAYGAVEFAEDSLGEFGQGGYCLSAGTYDVTLDLVNSTINFAQSSQNTSSLIRREFFKNLKSEGFNVYVNDDDVVLFDSVDEEYIQPSFEFTDSDSNNVDVEFEILNGDYYTVEASDSDYLLTLDYDFSDLQVNDSEKGLHVSYSIERYFVYVENALFTCVFRHLPTSFYLEDTSNISPTTIENNIYYFNEIYLSKSEYRFVSSPSFYNTISFQFVSQEGNALFQLSPDLKLTVPSEAQNNYFDIVFDFNTMRISITKSNIN